jgi:putative solute:sodium symporter small subunit
MLRRGQEFAAIGQIRRGTTTMPDERDAGGLSCLMSLSGQAFRGGHAMIESKERKPYWRHTKWQMLASLAPFVIAMIVVPIYADRLNSNKFLGFPLGYFLALHGIILIAIVTVASFVNRQDAIDHWHGAHEDL